MKKVKKRFTEVLGYLDADEGAVLQNFAKDKVVLDIGSYYGRSAVCFAEVAKKVITLDTYKGSHPDDQYQVLNFTTLDHFKENIAGYKNIEYHIGLSQEIIPKLKHQFDVVFVDCFHMYENVKNDILNSLRLLADDGLIVVHDYFNRVYPGVKKAVDEIFEDKDGEFADKLIWFKKKNLRVARGEVSEQQQGVFTVSTQ